MAPRYQTGQKVIINPVTTSNLSLRSSELEPYVGHTGEVKDYYWITPDRGVNVFYIYTVSMEQDSKEIVVHEDELDEYIE